jgi:hypothetical protein
VSLHEIRFHFENSPVFVGHTDGRVIAEMPRIWITGGTLRLIRDYYRRVDPRGLALFEDLEPELAPNGLMLYPLADFIVFAVAPGQERRCACECACRKGTPYADGLCSFCKRGFHRPLERITAGARSRSGRSMTDRLRALLGDR